MQVDNGFFHRVLQAIIYLLERTYPDSEVNIPVFDEIFDKLEEITLRLEDIMGKQQEFDVKITRANARLDELSVQLANEAQEIRDYIDAHPEVDTSALDGVVSRLEALDPTTVFTPPVEESPVV